MRRRQHIKFGPLIVEKSQSRYLTNFMIYSKARFLYNSRRLGQVLALVGMIVPKSRNARAPPQEQFPFP